MVVLDKSIEERLTRVYVALAMTREIAQRNASEELRSVERLICVASQLLEEVLDTTPDFQLLTKPSEIDLVM